MTLKVKVTSPFFSLAYSHVHILNSCKFGKNPGTHSKDNVHLSIFGLNFAISISNVTLKIRSGSSKPYQLFAMSMYKIHANWGKIS